MGMYKYIRAAWKKPKEGLGAEWQARLIRWRTEPSTLRIERPTRLDKARMLGYKAKEGYIIVRQRMPRGGRMRPKPAGGRRPKTARRNLVLGMNYQHVAEIRAASKYPNCEVLNSYYAGQDGHYYWFEIIFVDTHSPSILADDNINWIAGNKQKGRVYRGLTSSARKSRGLRWKGKGSEKARQ